MMIFVWFSTEGCKTKVITLANHNRCKQHNQNSKQIQSTPVFADTLGTASKELVSSIERVHNNGNKGEVKLGTWEQKLCF